MASISQATWHSLGLGVAVSWFTLGLIGIFQPARSAEIFGIKTSSAGGDKSSETGIALMFGSRDIAVASAILALGAAGMDEEMGTLILCTMVICAADIYLVWRAKRYRETVTFAIGAAIWGFIGLGLKGFFIN